MARQIEELLLLTCLGGFLAGITYAVTYAVTLAKCVLVFTDKSDSTRPGPLVFIRHVVACRKFPPNWLHRTLPA
jgi:hypothetical protein